MDKLDMESVNIVDENIEKIGNLFPDVIVESENGKAIDFNLLKQELSKDIVEGNREKYQLTWPGKKEAILIANTPTKNTLRPVREKSVDFDNTQNIYIEGDNLEALKILQESYLNKIKCIYIDPPYNTGNDFVYNDKYSKSEKEELIDSGRIDENGNILISKDINNSSKGQFHSDWLSMMYPRLKLARNLLSNDGVIFISIDDNEYENLKKITGEIFGENNYVATLIWRKKTGSADAKGFSVITEYILVYTKNISNLKKTFNKDLEAHDVNRYKLSDEYEARRGKYYIDNLDRGGIHYSDSLNYPIECPDGTITYPNGRKEFVREGWTWTWGKEKVKWGIENGFIEFRKSNTKESGWAVCYKNYLNVNNKDELVARSAPYKNMIMDILNTDATNEIKKIFDFKIFQYTKPTTLIKKILSYVQGKDYIVLDFFSGSATTAHAILQKNLEDKGKRKFIMVQLHEKCDEKSEAYKNGYQTICDIGEERIRRVAKKIKEETNADIDYNFRVYKIDSSNMNDVYYKPNDISQGQLDMFESNIKEDRTSEDLLTQVILDLGLTLDLKIEERNILNNKVYFVDDNSLIACFDNKIDINIIDEICKYKPLKVVFKDASFKYDNDKINLQERFKKLSPDTEINIL